ncbi:MAG TPA: energy-coupling factor ABC transporter permease [Thiopseudomonas sp.]|nr:energy-coupling factor ABC transporter permease [Thiopseudomonas sp.]
MIASMLLNETTLFWSWLLYGPILLYAIWRAPWVELFSDNRRQHLLFGTVFVLCILWLVRRDFPSGLSFHFIGMTAVTLLLDWPLAILAGFIAQLALLALGKQELSVLGVNGMLLIILPVFIAHCCARGIERLQPENLFMYIFFSGFFPAALTAALCIMSGTLLLWSSGIYELPSELGDFLGMILLVSFPEAFINGMAVTAFVVFKPEWLETFNYSRYLQAPWKDESDQEN